MGIAVNCTKFLMYSKKLGVDFETTLTLGRVNLYARPDEIESLCIKFDIGRDKFKSLDFSIEYAEPLFELMGADEVHSMDYSGYENADIIQDLNAAWPEKLDNSFSVIFDGGTLEHIFNFPQAIRSCMNALKPGGHFISITVANNYNGHGLYQFSPELFFRIFSKENGFAVKKMILTPGEKNWYEVTDPNLVNSRVQFKNSVYTRLMLIAEKIEDVEIFTSFPYQSDYSAIWSKNESALENTKQHGLKKLYQQVIPLSLKRIVRTAYDLFKGEKKYTRDMGIINPKHLKKISV